VPVPISLDREIGRGRGRCELKISSFHDLFFLRRAFLFTALYSSTTTSVFSGHG
jgi:hypothetical protein